MIIFKKIRYKNLLSTGNVFTELDLNSKKTTLISGSNGEGKSTLLDAIIFCLYGKPFRKINKSQLINSVNQKELLTEIEFTTGNKAYMVRRGIKPNKFEIYEDGNLINQDAQTKDYQEYLENNILKINMKSFTQIVILGSATYTPFMELNAQSRREVIEDLLDIQIFSTMNVLLKDRLQENKESMTEINHNIDLIETKIKSAKEHNESLNKIKSLETDKIKKKIKEELNYIESEDKQCKLLKESKEKEKHLISDKENIVSKIDKCKEYENDFKRKIRELNDELEFYKENDNCPTCKQAIDVIFKYETIENKKLKYEKLKQALDDLQLKKKKYIESKENIENIEQNISKLQEQIYEHNSNIKISKNNLKTYKTQIEDSQKQLETYDTAKLKEYEKEEKTLLKEQSSLFNERETLSVVHKLLKDGGIKTAIIKQYIPVMNKLINYYLSEFDLFVDFNLDENFNETIKSRHRDVFSYASFSEGEKLRISLSIMLTWREISKLRNSLSTNLLILDETLDGSIDTIGIEKQIETLHNMNDDDNIFVISHRGNEFGDKFESHIQFHKEKNFSKMQILE